MENTKKKLYIAGKVTGEDFQKCWDKFQDAQDLLEMYGFDVINPMKIVPKGTGWEESMEMLRPHLLNSDFVYLLPDWKESKGSVIERDLALAFKIEVVEHESLCR